MSFSSSINQQKNLPHLVLHFLNASLAENSRRAYAKDIQHFLASGGVIPASPESVATYLAENAEKFALATLNRRAVAIGKAHLAQGLPSPVNTELVKSTLKGMRRVYGMKQRRVKPIQPNQLRRMINHLSGTKGLRDRAILLLGFAGAFRRSELVALQFNDVRFVRKGMIIHLRKSKTDQNGIGRDVAIPYISNSLCSVKAMKAWLNKSKIKCGEIFRRIDRYGNVLDSGLSAQSVALIVKRLADSAGFDSSDYSGHSLRAGMVTSAAENGVSGWAICKITGHQSDAVMQRYIREADLFQHNPLRKMCAKK